MVPYVIIVLGLGILVVEWLFQTKSELCAFCNASIDGNA